MFAELTATIAGMKNEWLRKLLQVIFADEAIARAYRQAPAAKGIHHAWLGGLIEHVLSLAALASFTARHYPLIDSDLLMTGVILHDIGKISELKYDRSFSYTTDGQLLGHIQIGLRIVADKLAVLPGFPPKLRNLVEHLILSHHGQLEFGSPKVPSFAEALLLHHLDNLDSKMETLRASLERERNTGAEWTSYNHALERSLLDRERYLAGPAEPSRPAPGPRTAGNKAQATLFGEQLLGAIRQEE
jgi:3'-5' exoribonuclease